MRQFLALFLVLGFVFQAVAQPTQSITNSVTAPNTVSNSASNAPSVSNTGAPTGTTSITGSTSRTAPVSVTASNTWSGTNSISLSATVTPTSTISLPPPPGPLTVSNGCNHHIVTVCLTWTVPANSNFVNYLVFFNPTSAPANISIVGFPPGPPITKLFVNVGGLQPGTSYQFTVFGVTAQGLTSLPSPVGTFVTDQADAKLVPTEDIHNITCHPSKNSATNRVDIVCTWLAATPVLPIKLSIKCHCVSPIRRPTLIRKKLHGTKAQVNSFQFNINRDVTSCAIFFHAYYPRRPSSRQSLVLLVGE